MNMHILGRRPIRILAVLASGLGLVLALGVVPLGGSLQRRRLPHRPFRRAGVRGRRRSVTSPPDAAGVVIGDLASAAQTWELADQVNEIGRMDAVIHNAGVFLEPSRSATAEAHAKTLVVNTLAPYLLTALIGRPDRLSYLSSGLHYASGGSLRDIDWTGRRWNAAQAYSESKLYVTALALTLARAWPDVLSNAVDPGWVPTKMGGPAATGDLEQGYLTQTWLAVSNDAPATVSGGYWYHRQRQTPAPEARDPAFQDQLMDRLATLTGVALF
jgi:NAD(P)-dependent dehydrogenase (short-subunit alcohol dehydrogenase family)